MDHLLDLVIWRQLLTVWLHIYCMLAFSFITNCDGQLRVDVLWCLMSFVSCVSKTLNSINVLKIHYSRSFELWQMIFNNRSPQIFNVYLQNLQRKTEKCMCMSVCPKNSSQTVNGSDLKFAHVVLCAVRRSTVLFSIFNFQVFQLSTFPISHTSFKLESYCKQ